MKASTIHQILLFIVCALVVPGSIVGISASYRTYLDNVRQVDEQALQAARALVRDLDAEFQSMASTATALSTSPALRPADLRMFYEQAQQTFSRSDGRRLLLSDARGAYLFDTARPFGQTLPSRADPALLDRAAASGTPAISALAREESERRYRISVCQVVWDSARPAYFIEVGIDASALAPLLTRRRLPADWVITVFDASGTVAARSGTAQGLVGTQGRADLLREINLHQAGRSELAPPDGNLQHTLYSRSPQSGWSTTVDVPLASIRTPLWSSIGRSLAISFFMLGVGLWIATRAGALLQRGMRHLVHLSEQLGRSEPLTPRSIGVVEVDQVSCALATASALLHESEHRRDQAEAALQRANAELEQHVRMRTAELQQSRGLLSTVVEHMPAMLFAQRADDLRYVMLNRHGEQLIERARDQVLGCDDIELLGESQGRQRTVAARQALQSDHVVQTDEEDLLLPSGTRRTLRTLRIALRDAQGHAIHLLGISLDITAHRMAEEQLRIAAVAFESQEAMLITDARNIIVKVNAAFTKMSGYSSAETLGRKPSMLQSGYHDDAFYAAMWSTIERLGFWQGELWDRRKNDEIYPTWTTISAIHDAAGQISNYVCTQTDISARKQAEEEIRQLAFFDPLTHLPNRRLLRDRLRHVIDNAGRNGQHNALMFIDLDNFKLLNDTLGHDQGDQLLQMVAQRLPQCVRAGDTVARLGGDEFVVMLEELGADGNVAALRAQAVGDDILSELNRPYALAGCQYRCSPSIGVTMFSDHQIGVDDLLRRADLAMYQAKAQGRNTLRFFEAGMQTLVDAYTEMDHELQEALNHDQFELYYQPQVSQEGRIVGAEALLRWRHPRRGIIEPDQFIGVAEETGLILSIGQWVLGQACAALARWTQVPDLAHLELAVNVSSLQFRQPDFVTQVSNATDRSGADPRKLKLELTESLLLDDVAECIDKMHALRQRGIGLALDDFGTGYSSLSYLKRLPLDQLKIDRSFARDLLTDPHDAAIARIIVTLGHTLGLSIVAEGVETEAQRAFLAANQCACYQGFLFSQALPEPAFREFVLAAAKGHAAPAL
ncbi:EAL domain-containing protein [Duganella sp. FT134W]|uniref:EAL domain-containing protein n=1 Tax=Duganella margarita TaxID=2692170 RepID=A0A7X4KGY0_9BURK|nr:EAL domain-containing protein [Duganella margarita]MYM73971.1 EAL domain-containing protein [Duganella margarita]